MSPPKKANRRSKSLFSFVKIAVKACTCICTIYLNQTEIFSQTNKLSQIPKYSKSPDTRGIEDNSNINFLDSQKKKKKSICCDPSLEPCRQDGSSQGSQCVILWQYGNIWK